MGFNSDALTTICEQATPVYSLPPCELCANMRFVVPLVAGVPQRAVACVCFRKLLETQQQNGLQADMQLPPRLQAMTFDSCPWRSSKYERAFNACREFAYAPTGWLLLSGGQRRTYLAAAVANVRLGRGEAVQVVNSADFLDALRATFDSGGYDETFRTLRGCPLLILLDLGWEHTSGWSLEKLYQLLAHRRDWELPLVITLPQPVAELDARLRHLLNQHPDCQTLTV